MQVTVQTFGHLGFSANHANVIDFASEQSQDNWFNRYAQATIPNANFDKFNQQLDLSMKYTDAIKVSYVRFLWDNGDGTSKWFYYFVDSCDVIKANPTIQVIRFKLTEDVWQTYMFEYYVGFSSIERMHVDRWANNKPSRVTPCRESVTGYKASSSFTKIVDESTEGTPIYWVVMAFTESKRFIDDLADGKDVSYLVSPMKLDGSGYFLGRKTFPNDLGGIDEWQVYTPTFKWVFNNGLQYALQIPAESILGVFIVPNMNLSLTGVDLNQTVRGRNNDDLTVAEYPYDFRGSAGYDRVYDAFRFYKLEENELNTAINSNIVIPIEKPTRPTNNAIESPNFEPMLFMYPFRERFISAGNGAQLKRIEDNLIKYGVSEDNEVTIQTIFADSNISERIIINSTDDVGQDGIDGRSVTMNAVTCVVLSDAWLNYYLTTRDTDRAILANNILNQSIQSILSMGVGGGLVGARSGEAGKVASGVGVGVVGSLAGSFANAYLQTANQDLKEQQMRNQCSSMLSQGGAYGEFVFDSISPRIVSTKADDITMSNYYNIFRRYGYAIDAPMLPNLKSRKYMNYIKTRGAIIEGALNNAIKARIQEIYDNGVSIWHADMTPPNYLLTNTLPPDVNIERSLM